MRLGRLLAFGILFGLAVGCASPTPEEQMAIWREAAVSEPTWARVRPHLEELAAGDDLRIFEAAREIHEQGSGRSARPVVVIPSWITSLSGGATGGLSMFGQLIGRRDERIRGSHVFGTVSGGRIHPRYQVFTEATLVDPGEFEALRASGVRGVGQLPRADGVLSFRDLIVVATRPMGMREPPVGLPEDTLSSFYSEAAFRSIEPVLDALPEGTDLFSFLTLLGAGFLTDDFGESHRLRAPGFLQTRAVRTQTVLRPTGLFKLRPLGWLTEGGEVIDRIAIFRNDRLVRIVPHRGLPDWMEYLGAPLR